jgi:hypothetical protein
MDFICNSFINKDFRVETINRSKLGERDLMYCLRWIAHNLEGNQVFRATFLILTNFKWGRPVYEKRSNDMQLESHLNLCLNLET